ncbi:MAG: CehA/McbA family metallohydrolase [Gemmataceae bacterium]
MRTVLLATGCVLGVGLCAFLGARTSEETVPVRLRLIDAETGASVGGLVRVAPADGGKPLVLPGLLNRLQGLGKSLMAEGWHVVPAGGVETTLPRGPVRLEALSGLESRVTRQDIDLRQAPPRQLDVKLTFLFRSEKDGLAAGNTHLHLRNMTLAEADDYLRQIPAADGLKVLFISYLERFQDDKTYITNQYPIGDLPQFDTTGVLINNGEEHRHNFEGFGQGYGHVMFLNIKRLVQPVSIGPGITGGGNDDTPLQPGIDNARAQGGTVIWCHNTNGHEDVPNALSQRLDALNVFDGSRTGSFEENYYRYLNVGLRMPISTGTDWFMYDFARVYAQTGATVTISSWLQAVKEGRCIATNGPLLSLTVNGHPIGAVVKLDQPTKARIEVKGLGRHDFQKMHLIHNGRIIQTQTAAATEGGFTAHLTREMVIDGPSWFAARIDATTKNELDRPLYAHTSPVYLDFAGQRVFDVEAARGLLKQLEEGQADIRARSRFSSPEALRQVEAIYTHAATLLRQRMSQRGK